MQEISRRCSPSSLGRHDCGQTPCSRHDPRRHLCGTDISTTFFGAWTIWSKRPQPPSWTPSASSTPLPEKTVQTAEEAWQQVTQGHSRPSIAGPRIAETEQTDPTLQVDNGDEVTYVFAWRGRLNSPQIQGQLYRLSGRTRLRRFKNTLQVEGAWQQVARIEDFCHMHVSH